MTSPEEEEPFVQDYSPAGLSPLSLETSQDSEHEFLQQQYQQQRKARTRRWCALFLVVAIVLFVAVHRISSTTEEYDKDEGKIGNTKEGEFLSSTSEEEDNNKVPIKEGGAPQTTEAEEKDEGTIEPMKEDDDLSSTTEEDNGNKVSKKDEEEEDGQSSTTEAEKQNEEEEEPIKEEDGTSSAIDAEKNDGGITEATKEEEIKDSYYMSVSQIPPPHFPWQHSIATKHIEDDVSDDNITQMYLGMIENLEAKTNSVLLREKNHEPTPDHDPSLYVIRNGELWVPPSQQAHWKTDEWLFLYNGRLDHIEHTIQSALNISKQLSNNIFPERWRELLWNDNVAVPLYLNAHDDIQIGCGIPEMSKVNPSQLPVFGWSTNPSAKRFESVGCKGCEILPFAIPCYEFWDGMTRQGTGRNIPSDWLTSANPDKVPDPESSLIWHMTMEEMEGRFPWTSKEPKAVWRGSTTGPRDTDWRDLPRSQLVNASINRPDILDAGFTGITVRWDENQTSVEEEIHRFSRMADPIYPIEFMRYKAIIDIDGNAWSSRFGQLMCMNSVVLKVAPSTVDYWYDELKPWVHYIPVHSDLSNLMEQVEHAVDPSNDKQIREMVSHANDWCQHKMTTTQMAVDMLWILGNYLDVLHAAIGSRIELNKWLAQWRNANDDLSFERVGN